MTYIKINDISLSKIILSIDYIYNLRIKPLIYEIRRLHDLQFDKLNIYIYKTKYKQYIKSLCNLRDEYSYKIENKNSPYYKNLAEVSVYIYYIKKIKHFYFPILHITII